MIKEFKFPDIGEGIEEGRIVKLLIREGDFIKEHQAVAEIETDKAVAEIPSPFEGKIIKINFKEGDIIKVGQTIFVIDVPESNLLFQNQNNVHLEKENIKEEKVKPAGAVGYLEESSEEILATPAVRKMARDLGVDLTKIKGTGPGGRITEKDLEQFKNDKIKEESKAENNLTQSMKKKKKYDMWGYVDYLPLNNIRKVASKHLTEAWQKVPQVTLMIEPEIKELIDFREKKIVEAEKRGIKLTYLPFLMKACWKAMEHFPLINSVFDEVNQEIIIKKYYNFGVAVDVGGEGLLVPVVKGVNIKSIYEIAKEIVQLADKARNRKIDIQDLRGGTFTITNYGSLGGIFATPIINFPEIAILGVGRIRDNKIPLSLTFDHRILDGAYAIRFLNSLTIYLQNPQELFNL